MEDGGCNPPSGPGHPIVRKAALPLTPHISPVAHRTGRNKGTNDRVSRAQLSFPRTRQLPLSPPCSLSTRVHHRADRKPNGRWPKMGNQREGIQKLLRDGHCVTARSVSSIPPPCSPSCMPYMQPASGIRPGKVIRSPRQTSAGRGTECRQDRHVPRRVHGRGRGSSFYWARTPQSGPGGPITQLRVASDRPFAS